MLYWCVIYAVIILVVYPSMMGVLPVAILIIVLVLKFAMRTYIDSLRHDTITRSPINSLFSTTLESLITLRAYRRQNTLTAQFEELVDQNGRAYFTYIVVTRWYGLLVEITGALWISGTIIYSFFSVPSDPAAKSNTALAITSSLVILGCF